MTYALIALAIAAVIVWAVYKFRYDDIDVGQSERDLWG